MGYFLKDEESAKSFQSLRDKLVLDPNMLKDPSANYKRGLLNDSFGNRNFSLYGRNSLLPYSGRYKSLGPDDYDRTTFGATVNQEPILSGTYAKNAYFGK